MPEDPRVLGSTVFGPSVPAVMYFDVTAVNLRDCITRWLAVHQAGAGPQTHAVNAHRVRAHQGISRVLHLEAGWRLYQGVRRRPRPVPRSVRDGDHVRLLGGCSPSISLSRSSQCLSCLYAVVLGLTHSIDELLRSVQPSVGKLAIAAWSVSLALGIITCLMLNHVYG